MTAALLLSSGSLDASPLAADLQSSGIDVCGETNCTDLLQDVIKKAADIVVCFQETPDAAFFASIAAVCTSMPRPVVVFTQDPDAAKMAVAMASGVHAYVVAGYASARLRSVIQLAQARFRHEQVLRQELADVQRRFDERKLVDRAKGILMGARQLREEEAFRALRSAAMASKRRIGQVSQIVIDSAHYAEAVNRAGQLRMLTQRIVKFYALACSGVTGPQYRDLLADSVAQVGANLATLDRSLSQATFGDLLGTLKAPWGELQAAVKSRPAAARVHAVDSLAEQVLECAETLTANLEVAAFATVLHPINVAGRQRMLTQRLAKEVLISALDDEPATHVTSPGRSEAYRAFVDGLDYLDRLPLSNQAIASELEAIHVTWEAFQRGLDLRSSADGRVHIAEVSEVMLGHFDRLTDLIERGIHALVGL